MFTFLLIAFIIFLVIEICYLKKCLSDVQEELQNTIDDFEHESCLNDKYILDLKQDIKSKTKYIEVLNIYNRIKKGEEDNTQSPPSL